MPIKQYMNPNALVENLKSKGVIITNKEKTINIVKKYSYYSIVNCYKEVFKCGKNYRKRVSFNEIYSLYIFDKNLRYIFLKYILEIENILKSQISEILSSQYGVKEYLIIDNFDERIDSSIINTIIEKINMEIHNQIGKHEAITHYYLKYGFIPPFVLTKILSFGDLSRLYSILKQSDRQSVSKVFKISDKLLKQIMKNITLVRNICAHNDRLFCFRSKFLLPLKEISYNNQVTNIYQIKKSMEIILGKSGSITFNLLIDKEIKKLSKRLKSISIDNILYLMGFTQWKIIK